MGIAAANASSMKTGKYGALENAEKEDSHYFVQWVGEPYELNEVSDINKIFTPEGTLVCNARYLNKSGYCDWLYVIKSNEPGPVNLKTVLDTGCHLLSVAHLPKRVLYRATRK